jgi:RNA polymerase sigma-70 factor (ECF subfamily)
MALENACEPLDRERSDPRLEKLHIALYGLPARDREVLVLSRYEGLSYAEIADVCETTVGAIKTRAHRAMRALRDRYTELEQQHEL